MSNPTGLSPKEVEALEAAGVIQVDPSLKKFIQGRPKLNEREMRVCNFIENYYYINSSVPSEDVICSTLDEKPLFVKNLWKKSEFRDELYRMGINITPMNEVDVTLSPEQLKVANMLLNIVDGRSVREKLKAAEVTPRQYQAWRSQPAFMAYLTKRSEELFKGADADAYQGLAKMVAAGDDLNAIKFFMEVRGIYNPKLQIDFNVNVFMTKIFEIVTRHVTDETTLLSIATDLETLELG